MKNGKSLTKDILLEVFDVKKTSPLYEFANDLANWIVKNVKEQSIKTIHNEYCTGRVDISVDEMMNEIIEDYGGMKKELLEKIAKGEYKYYDGYASDDSGYGLETYLCETQMNIETDDIIIKSNGGY